MDALAQRSAPAPSCDWPDWPAYGLVDDLLPTLERWVADGRRCALATLVRISGSSPRPLGSEMAIDARGECVGYVSGGCVEAAVAAEALAVLADGRPRLLDYGAGSPVLDIQLSCGGRIGIFVRELAAPRAYVARLREARARRQPLYALTDLASGAMQLADTEPEFADGRFVREHRPPLRLIAVGADPVSLALAYLAPQMGIETVLLRPLGPEAPPPGSNLLHYDRRPLAAALAGLRLDARCAVYTLTHDAEADHAVLAAALRSPAYCVGALGSRRKAELRRQQLRAEGIAEARIAELRSPAGLYLAGTGAHAPQQIALSIVGEMLAAVPQT
ncbi:XdhC family protein [Solimonas flava]|uniref:XdhC family protein n=1 Tax=Solimonas flava TaxID=415849 RepID=UPI0004027094|nr:XdhC family protein [Solimonas flava]